MEGHNFNINSKHGILALPSIKERLDAIIKELKTQQLRKQSHKRKLAEQVLEKLPDLRPEVISKLQAEEFREERRRKRQNHLQDLRYRLAELKKLHDTRVIIKKFSRLSIVPHDEKKQPAKENECIEQHLTKVDSGKEDERNCDDDAMGGGKENDDQVMIL